VIDVAVRVAVVGEVTDAGAAYTAVVVVVEFRLPAPLSVHVTPAAEVSFNTVALTFSVAPVSTALAVPGVSWTA
jgi:hypothetical protein